jgi:hypothetical protein
LVCAVLIAAWSQSAAAQEKIAIKTADELPRHEYKIPGTASELLKNPEQLSGLARQVRADIQADLEKYQIEDASTLQELHGVLLSLDLLDGRYEDALKHLALMRELEQKPAKKLTMGLLTEAYIAARAEAGEDQDKLRAAVGRRLSEKLRGLPWDVVGDEIEQNKGRMEILSESLLAGMVQSSIDPVVAKTGGTISADIGRRLVGLHVVLTIQLPLKGEVVAAYQAVIDQHRVAKKDIWAQRAVTLSADQRLAPVVVAIWDSGTDTSVFPGQLFVNPKEKQNGEDDDGNGYVDDLHGIGFDLDGNRTPELLHPLADMKAETAEVARQLKGFMDLQAAIDSPEAAAVKKVVSGLEGEAVKRFIEDLSLYGNYAHGTHVAGIVIEGNPFVRLLPARLTFDYRMIPLCPTMERMERDAAAARDTVEYFKQHGVRVVNMSWGRDQEEIESPLEKNGVGETAEERAEIARKMYKVQRDGLFEAIKGAPDILFIAAAGNADNDVEFQETIPSGFDLPNLLVVGAVDQAGDPTSFTSFGKTVRVYANGFEVDSFVPGGQRMKLSGTSMSAPNVANLAAKLLALEPSLSPTRVIELIKKGADKVEGARPMLLINPKRTVELLKEK